MWPFSPAAGHGAYHAALLGVDVVLDGLDLGLIAGLVRPILTLS